MFRLITIEREYGCGAAAIAAQLADHLGWKLWDHLLTEEIARLANVDRSAVMRCDERMDSRLHRLAKSFWRGSYERNSAALGSQVFDTDCMMSMMQEIDEQDWAGRERGDRGTRRAVFPARESRRVPRFSVRSARRENPPHHRRRTHRRRSRGDWSIPSIASASPT